jgi:hypothetical protein
MNLMLADVVIEPEQLEQALRLALPRNFELQMRLTTRLAEAFAAVFREILLETAQGDVEPMVFVGEVVA